MASSLSRRILGGPSLINYSYLLQNFSPMIISRKFLSEFYPLISSKGFSTSSVKHLREVREKVEDNVVTVEGKYVDSVRKDHLINLSRSPVPGTCVLCEIDVRYTDVLIISQFTRPDGELLPQEITGLCRKKHAQMERLLLQAKSAGLLPNLRPDSEDGAERPIMDQYKWKKYNVYYEPYKKYQLM